MVQNAWQRAKALGTDELCVALVALATLWFGLAAAWELFAPFGAGHVSSSTAIGIAAENMLRWHILAPVPHYTHLRPAPSEFYCHHPWGIFWISAGFIAVLGHHDWVLRLPPVLMSAAMPALIFASGRSLFGPVGGAAGAVTFTVVPIALAFADFNSLEVPVMFGVALSIWGIVRFSHWWRRRDLALSLTGLGLALIADWPAFVFAAVVLGLGLVRGLCLSSRYFPALDGRRFWHWWALSATLSTAIALFFVARFHGAGQLVELIQAGQWRAHGAAQPLWRVLESRRHWIELSFTPLGVLLGKLALPVLLARVLFWRRDLEALPLAVLVMATAQYVVFRQGADIHVFWPQYFALYLAFAIGALTASLEGGLAAGLTLLERRSGRALISPGRLPLIALGLGVLPALLILPDGVRGLVYAHRTGKRFDEKGLIIHQDLDKTLAVREVSAQLGPEATLLVHPSMKPTWSIDWAARRPTRITGMVPQGLASSESFVLDARFTGAAELRALAQRFSLEVYGPYWFARSGPAGLVAYRFVRREPGPFERYVSAGVDPVLSVAEDPFATWELKHHLDVAPNPPPMAAPTTLDQLRVAHNMALADGDAARARPLFDQLLSRLDRGPAAVYSGGTELVGTSIEGDVAPLLRVVFRAGGPSLGAWGFDIASIVEQKAACSLVPRDEKERAVGMPFALPTLLWKAGYLYSADSELRARPGSERFEGWPDGPGAPVALGGRPRVIVARLP